MSKAKQGAAKKEIVAAMAAMVKPRKAGRVKITSEYISWDRKDVKWSEPTPAKKVAIVGAAPSSRDLAPYDDQSWEIWGCSPSNREKFPRITSWFELHDVHFLKQAKHDVWTKPYRKWLKDQTCRVVMQCENDIAPKAFVYPWEAVKALCPHGGHLLTSSVALQIALAIIEGASEIGIYGVDMAADTEWAYELPGCQIWIARARERGIKVYVPDDSSLDLPIPIYGLDDAKPASRKLREQVAEMVARRKVVADELNAIDARKAALLREHYVMDGAIEGTNWVRKTIHSWSGPDLG